MMAQKATGRDAGQVLVSERERTLATAIRRRTRYIYSLQRSFEEAGCSCAPYRERLQELEKQYNAERERLLYPLETSDVAIEIEQLRKKVEEVDRREHPSLDAAGRDAQPYLTVWLFDQVRAGDAELLAGSDTEITDAYAQAWMGGWRPRSLYKPRRRRAVR